MSLQGHRISDEQSREIHGPYAKFESPVICKCGSKDLRLIEIWDGHGIVFTQENGVYSEEGYITGGDPASIDAECLVCGLRWSTGYDQIIQIGQGYDNLTICNRCGCPHARSNSSRYGVTRANSCYQNKAVPKPHKADKKWRIHR